MKGTVETIPLLVSYGVFPAHENQDQDLNHNLVPILAFIDIVNIKK